MYAVDCRCRANRQLEKGDGMELVKGTLDILILKAVSWLPAHGYDISRWIGQQSGGVLQVDEGALYQALRRLELRGLLRSEWGITHTGREAKFYELTAEGRRQLAGRAKSWDAYAAAMARVIKSRRAPGEVST
jgi:PadR family transcriptional regulator PadR